MSRVGMSPIDVPSDVNVLIDSKTITVNGPKGSLSIAQICGVNVNLNNNQILLDIDNDSKLLNQKWGLQRSLIKNLISGVVSGYQKQLDIIGVGYRAELSGDTLILKLGFSHDVNFLVPGDVSISVPKPTQIIISGIDKQRVGQVASDIRSYRGPEPYKGKGIRYNNESVVLKQIKKK